MACSLGFTFVPSSASTKLHLLLNHLRLSDRPLNVKQSEPAASGFEAHRLALLRNGSLVSAFCRRTDNNGRRVPC